MDGKAKRHSSQSTHPRGALPFWFNPILRTLRLEYHLYRSKFVFSLFTYLCESVFYIYAWASLYYYCRCLINCMRCSALCRMRQNRISIQYSWIGRLISACLFQSTHPRGVRHRCANSFCTAFGFQSTHPRGVRRYGDLLRRSGIGISIHAPAWGATHSSPHRRGRGYNFNPRTRVGCDSKSL